MSVLVDPSMSAESQQPFYQTDDWEHPLDFRGPLAVTAGSVIRMRCDYKNTDPVDVFQGPNAATSEMCVFTSLYSRKSRESSRLARAVGDGDRREPMSPIC